MKSENSTYFLFLPSDDYSGIFLSLITTFFSFIYLFIYTVLKKKLHYSCYVNAKQQMVFEEKASGI